MAAGGPVFVSVSCPSPTHPPDLFLPLHKRLALLLLKPITNRHVVTTSPERAIDGSTFWADTRKVKEDGRPSAESFHTASSHPTLAKLVLVSHRILRSPQTAAKSNHEFSSDDTKKKSPAFWCDTFLNRELLSFKCCNNR